MARIARDSMQMRKAERFRKIIRDRKLETRLTIADLCPPEWCATSEESGLRKLKRILAPKQSIALEDAWDLVEHLQRIRLVSLDGRRRAFIGGDGMFVQTKSDLTAEVDRVVGLSNSERQDAFKAFDAYNALGNLLIDHIKFKRPALAIFEGQTEHLSHALVSVVVKAIGNLSKVRLAKLETAFNQKLFPYERQLKDTERGRELVSHLKGTLGKHGVDFQLLFLGLSGTDSPRINPWRSSSSN